VSFLRNIYNRFAQRIYSVGRKNYLEYQERMMHERGIVGEGTKFYDGAELVNFSTKKGNIEIGKGSHISGLIMVYAYGGMIKIGDYCSVSPNTRIISTQNISIGNRVLIAHNVNIIDNISHPIDARLRHEDFIKSFSVGMMQYDLKPASVIIEDDVWIGFNTTILKGVKIGRGAILGAGSFVTKDVKAWTVNAGNPLRCLRELDPVEVNHENI
jgi:acetyltransferase-like isoleucine patch superfamily enzyme